MKKILTLFVFISIIISIAGTAKAQTILYVNAAATGDNNGSSWINAYTQLSDALQLTHSNPETQYDIWVAAGTYKPTAHPAACTGCSGPRDYTFHLKNGVKLYGGFAGTETMLTERDIVANETIFSGDIGTVGDASDNAYHVVLSVSDDNTTVLDGFMVSGGNANGFSNSGINVESAIIYKDIGGGIYNVFSSPTITNTTFTRNSVAKGGGGMANLSSSPIISNATFTDNSANHGAGMYNLSSSPIITNATFTGNTAFNWGGGMHNFYNSAPIITNATFTGNTATNNGGGMVNQTSCSPIITNATFIGNSASQGGGMYNVSYCFPSITQATFTGNSAASQGGGVFNFLSSPNIYNSIIWNNGTEIFNYNGFPAVTYSIIQDGFPGIGNLDADPLFVDPLNGDIRLTSCSPAINAGSNAAIPMGITTDLDGNPRLIGAAIDMGAYEYQNIVYPPTIACPTITQTVYLAANCSATLPNYTLFANAYSFCGVQSVTQFPEPGSGVYGEGTITVTLTVTSNNGLTSQCSFLVFVEDNTLPTIICPTNQTVTLGQDCTGYLQNYVSLAQASDNCNLQNVIQGPAPFTSVSGTGFVNVTLTAFDVNGNLSQCNFTVTKVDISPPTITCPSTQTLILGNNCSASLPNFTGLAVTSDNCSVQFVSQMPAVGTTVSGAGNAIVSLTVTDANGLSNSCSFTVTKVDNSSPSIQCSNQTINFNGETSISPDPNDLVEASDNCGIQNISLSPASINSSQIGQTVPVLVTVTDINGISSTCTSQINIGGLPSGWSQNINGVGCSEGNDIEYNAATEEWTATSTNCFYGSPFTSDQTSFAQRTLCGNGSITAQVTGISGTSLGWAGVVMRENNAGGAKKAQLTSNIAGSQSRREFRVATNGNAFPQNFPAQNRYWLRIIRSGNQFAMYNSQNGVQWFLVGTQTIAMGSCIEIGLVATNYNSSSTVIATFENVSFTGNEQVLPVSNPDNDLLATANIQPDFSVYPNPASGELNIELKEYIGKNVQIELYSMEGKLMQLIQLEEILENTQTIQLDSYSNGMYFVKLKSAGLPDVMKRVVLTKN